MAPYEIFGIPVSGSKYYDITGRKYDLPTFNKCSPDTIRSIALAKPGGEFAQRHAESISVAKEIYNQIMTEIGGTPLKIPSTKNQTVKDYFDDVRSVYETARAQYEQLISTHKAARDRFNRATKEYAGNETQLTIAKGEWLKADDEYKRNMRALENKRDTDIAEIRGRLSEHLNTFYMAAPDKLDAASMQLLSTGILTGRELDNLASLHKNNPTMLRVIGKHARDMVDALRKDGASISESPDYNCALVLHEKISRMGSGAQELQLFDNLSQAATYCTSGKRASYPNGFLNLWDQTYAAVENDMTALPTYTGAEE